MCISPRKKGQKKEEEEKKKEKEREKTIAGKEVLLHHFVSEN